MLDPLADKLLVTSSFIVLALQSSILTARIPPWIAISHYLYWMRTILSEQENV